MNNINNKSSNFYRNIKRLSTTNTHRVKPRKGTVIITCLIVFFISACSGGGGADAPQSPQAQPDPSVEGSGVKGPLINADVNLYTLDFTSQTLHNGEAIASGRTNTQAVITDMSVSRERLSEGPFILEVAEGSELNNTIPAIRKLRVIISSDEIKAGKPIYATPLTTLHIELARQSADLTNSDLASGNFTTQLSLMEAFIIENFGLSLLDKKTDLRLQAPIFTEGGDQIAALNYRTAIEVFAVMMTQLQAFSPNTSTDSLLSGLAEDLSDGNLDGLAGANAVLAFQTIANQELLSVFQQSPQALLAMQSPGSSFTIAQLKDQMTQESQSMNPNVVPIAINAPTISPRVPGNDNDNDGIADVVDDFPNDPTRSGDTDGDGYDNLVDRFPNDEFEWDDSDDDGIGDNSDTCRFSATQTSDRDGDGICDYRDFAPDDPSVQFDPSSVNAPVAVALASDYDTGNNNELNQPALSVGLQSHVELSGSGSTDADGDLLVYSWAIISKPAGSSAALNKSGGAAVTLNSGDLQGDIVVELTVDDGQLSNTDTITITVNKDLPTSSALMGLSLLLLASLKLKNRLKQ